MLNGCARTWERAVRARFYLAEAETKRNRWYRTQKSQCYARIGDAGINILETKRAEFDRECVTQQEKLSASLSALVDYHDSITYGFDLGQRYNVIEEVSNFISESKAFIHQIDVHIRDFKNRDVLVVEPSLDQTWQGSPPLQHEEQAIQSRLEEVDETLEEVHAELTFSHPRNVKEIVDEVFDARIDHLREVRDLEMQQTPLDLDIPLESRQQLKQVMNRWQEAESKLPKTISDISSLITENAQLSRRIEQLEKENVAHYETIAKVGGFTCDLCEPHADTVAGETCHRRSAPTDAEVTSRLGAVHTHWSPTSFGTFNASTASHWGTSAYYQ